MLDEELESDNTRQILRAIENADEVTYSRDDYLVKK